MEETTPSKNHFFLKKNKNKPKEIVYDLKDNLYEFYGEREQSDDLTPLALIYF